MKDAPQRLQWAMNHCLAQIGIEHPELRARAIDIGERLEVLKDYPTPPGCTVNCWCSNKVEIKRARMAGIDILITNRAVLFHVRTYVYHRREEARRVGIYIDSDKIAREFRRWFWDTFESDQAETIGDDEYSEWAIPPLAPKPDK
jgi:hypothetical protein